MDANSLWQEAFSGLVYKKGLEWYPNIVSGTISAAKEFYHLDEDEQIYYVHRSDDFSEFLFLITDKRICFKYHDIKWSNIVEVEEMQGSSILVKAETDEFSIDKRSHGIPDRFFSYFVYAIKSFLGVLASSTYYDFYVKYVELEFEKKYKDAIELAKTAIQVPILRDRRLRIADDLIRLYILSDENSKAIEECNRWLLRIGKGSIEYDWYYYYNIKHQRYLANEKIGNYAEARKDCFELLNDVTGDDSEEDELREDFHRIDIKYSDTFLNRPYKDRKVIMLVKEYVDLNVENISLLNINNLENFHFPLGHPIANQLYVGHPLINNKYIPFEDYQLEFVEDRVREFCELAQCLGATELNIECLNSTDSDRSDAATKDVSGGFGGKKIGLSAEYKNETTKRLMEAISNSISLHQTFEPKTTPCVPPDLVWYNSEPSWQRLYKQRMEGGLLSHEERIETKKSQMVEGRELVAIKGEISGLFRTLQLSFDKDEESKFEQQDNAVLSIKVKFAPLSQLLQAETANIATPSTSTANSFSESENEYLESVKEMLEDGEITDMKRRMLERIRTAYDISVQRAQEIEESLKAPQLSEEEQDYLEACKDVATDRNIPEAHRKILDRLRKASDISEERAREIEKMI